MFYNTTKEVGEDLKEYKSKAISQDEIIIRHFLKHPYQEFSPSELWINLFEVEFTPLTSIRRSLNTLTRAGNLIKLDKMKCGIYGRREHYFKLNKK